MACKMYVLLVAAVVAAAALQCKVAATNHNISWTIPSGTTNYSSWNENNTVRVGDILVFNFRTGNHDVQQVTEAGYNACTTTNGIGSVQNTAPVTVNLNTTGSHYFICTFGTHCTQGQKLSVNVLAASAAPTPAPSTTSAPPPPATPSTPASPTGSPTTPASSSSGVFASVIVSVSAVVLGFCV